MVVKFAFRIKRVDFGDIVDELRPWNTFLPTQTLVLASIDDDTLQAYQWPQIVEVCLGLPIQHLYAMSTLEREPQLTNVLLRGRSEKMTDLPGERFAVDKCQTDGGMGDFTGLFEKKSAAQEWC